MGIDFQRVKELANEEDQKSRGGGGRFFLRWTPKVGKNRVRIMPPWATEGYNKNIPFRCLYQHFGVAGDGSRRPYLCVAKTPDGPRTPCPICAYVDKLRGTGQPADAELAQEIRASVTHMVNMVDLNDATYTDEDLAEWTNAQEDKSRTAPFAVGDTKIQLWSFGATIYKALLDWLASQSLDFTSFEDGRDITIKRVGTDKNHTEYSVIIDVAASKFNLKGRPLNEALFDLDAIATFSSTEELTALVNNLAGQLGAAPAAAKPSLPPANGTVLRPPAKETQKPAAAAAPPVDETDAPPCYKDLITVSPSDAECVGGDKDGESYDPCPYYAECSSAKAQTAKPKAPSRRVKTAAAEAAPTTPVNPDVDSLETKMRASLRTK